MIQASPQMADRLRRIKLRPVVTNPANAIIIDKLQKRISAGGPGSGRHVGFGVGDRARFGNRLGKITKVHPDGTYSFKHKDGNFRVPEHMLELPTKGSSEKLPNFGDKHPAMPDSKGRFLKSGGPGSGPHPGGGKELWQQTRKEAGVGEAPVIPDAHRPLHKLYGPNWEQHPDIANLKKEVSRVNGLRSKAIKEHKQYVQRSNEHLQSVRDAINQGKQVPPDVMNDYPFIRASIKADGSINWTSPSGPVGPDWYDAYIGTSPIPNDHPPSLKNPKLTKIPTAQDGWKKGDSKQARDQAMSDLVELHKRLRRQTGKPEVSFPTPAPVYPMGVSASKIKGKHV